MKTSELTGAALDWAVTKAEGFDHEVTSSEWGMWGWATDWAQGGPIIEREKIDVIADPNGKDVWMGRLYQNRAEYKAFAATPLIAAMRCYVASKLGDDINIPEELL
jgi:hypothetical protein